jgi:hypothetical protein
MLDVGNIVCIWTVWRVACGGNKGPLRHSKALEFIIAVTKLAVTKLAVTKLAVTKLAVTKLLLYQ